MASREWIEVDAVRHHSTDLAHRLEIYGQKYWVPRSVSRPSTKPGKFLVQHWWLQKHGVM